MLKAVIDYKKCEDKHCKKCVARLQCKAGAIIRLDPESSAAIIWDACNSCGKCVAACVGSAIIIVER